MPLISFYCLIALARTSNTLLNKSDESGHLCLVLDITFSFSPVSLMLAVGLAYMAYIHVEICAFYTHFIEFFKRKWVLNLVECFICMYLDDHIIFILYFVNVVYHVE